MTTLWDTTGTAVVKALAAERRTGGAVMSGLALTLVVVVDEKDVAQAEAAATTAASRHPCRLLVVIRRQVDAPVPRLDAEVLVGGRLGPGESVVMRMYGRLGLHAESVTLPLLAPDAPVVTWWHGPAPELIAHDPLGVFADRRVTDVSRRPDPVDALRQRAEDYRPGDTDLAWTRTTTWRAELASAFDTVRGAPVSAKVVGRRDDPAALLLAGWLSARFGVPVPVEQAPGRAPGAGGIGVGEVAVTLADGGSVRVVRKDSTSVLLERTGQPDNEVSLPERELGELLAEELRRLDADQPYADALGVAAGIPGLADRPDEPRTHIWLDPMQQNGQGAPVSPPPAPATAAETDTADSAHGEGGLPRVSRPEVVVHATADLLAKAAAARLVTRLVDAQAASGSASVVLTGGGIGTATLRELRDSPARDAVDWRRVTIWWGDERFVPADDKDRNDLQAAEALLDSVPLDRTRVHPFPAADGPFAGDPEAAAGAYAAELRAATRPEDHGPVPRFDVLLLGIGEEGHVASIFPESPAAYEERPVVAVRGSPKPPPVRLTMTFPAISAATEVWVLAAGGSKAAAVALALGGAGPVQVPAAGARGRSRTLWLVDRPAASRLPPSIVRLPVS